MNGIHGGDIYEVAAQTGLDPETIVDFSASINPLGLSKKAERELQRGLSAVLHYPDRQCRSLIQALAQFHGLEENQLMAGAGSTEFIYALPRLLAIKRPLIVTPAFSEYENGLAYSAGGEDCRIHSFETREEDGFELDVEGLLLAMAQGCDALYLANPGNPTGILTDRESLLRIAARAERENIWFILDEAFIDFAEEESLKGEAAAASRLILLRSLTNFFALPGLRVGYLISNPEMIQKLSWNKEPWRVNGLAQIAAVESLLDKGYIVRTRSLIALERERLIQGLRSIPGFVPYPGAANYLLVQLHPSLNLTAAGLREKLIPQGILIRDCRSFHPIGPDFFRIAVRSRRENNLLIKALRQVRRDLRT